MKSLRLLLALGFASALFAGFARAAEEKKADASCGSCCCKEKCGDKGEKKSEEKKP